MKALLEALSLFATRLPDEFAVLLRREDKPVRNSNPADDDDRSSQTIVSTVINKQFDDFRELQLRKEKKAKGQKGADFQNIALTNPEHFAKLADGLVMLLRTHPGEVHLLPPNGW